MSALVVGPIIFGAWAGSLLAQQKPTLPATTAAASEAPALSELETAYVQIVSLAGQLAQCQAAQLDTAKQFADIRKDAIGRIEKAHPGFTIDWATGKLAPVTSSK